MQLVDTVFISQHINVVHPGFYGIIAKFHIKGHIRFAQPGILFNPVVLLGILQLVGKHLPEKTEVVI